MELCICDCSSLAHLLQPCQVSGWQVLKEDDILPFLTEMMYWYVLVRKSWMMCEGKLGWQVFCLRQAENFLKNHKRLLKTWRYSAGSFSYATVQKFSRCYAEVTSATVVWGFFLFYFSTFPSSFNRIIQKTSPVVWLYCLEISSSYMLQIHFKPPLLCVFLTDTVNNFGMIQGFVIASKAHLSLCLY